MTSCANYAALHQIQMTKNRESTDDKQETTHNYDTHTHPYRSVPVMTGGQHPILSLLRDTGTPSHFTPADCGRATNQVHRLKAKRAKIQVPKCIMLIDKTRPWRGAKNWAFLEPRAASKRHFVVSSSGLSGLHPALPPMAESLGALSSTKFDGGVIENEKRGC